MQRRHYSEPDGPIVRLEGRSIREQDWEEISRLAAEVKAREEAEAALALEANFQSPPEPTRRSGLLGLLRRAPSNPEPVPVQTETFQPNSDRPELPDSQEHSPRVPREAVPAEAATPTGKDAWGSWDRAIAYACSALEPDPLPQTVVDYSAFLKK